jgi:cyanophycinase
MAFLPIDFPEETFVTGDANMSRRTGSQPIKPLLSPWVCALLLLLALASPSAVAQQPKSWGPPNGTLLIIGGGVPGAVIRATAARLAGGEAKWVVIPTAAEDGEIDQLRHNNFAAYLGQPYTVLHTRDRAEADSETFVAPLKTATAVWFVGGRQWRIVDAYGGTRTEREIRAVLDRGGLIAGTSAGATIQGSFLVRGAVSNNRVMMAPGHERGSDYLGNVAIDQHISARGREGDLARVVAANPGLLGIGIDESTALVVQGNIATVIGVGHVLITDGADHDGKPDYPLAPGDRFDLATWSRLPPQR